MVSGHTGLADALFLIAAVLAGLAGVVELVGRQVPTMVRALLSIAVCLIAVGWFVL